MLFGLVAQALQLGEECRSFQTSDSPALCGTAAIHWERRNSALSFVSVCSTQAVDADV